MPEKLAQRSFVRSSTPILVKHLSDPEASFVEYSKPSVTDKRLQPNQPVHHSYDDWIGEPDQKNLVARLPIASNPWPFV